MVPCGSGEDEVSVRALSACHRGVFIAAPPFSRLSFLHYAHPSSIHQTINFFLSFPSTPIRYGSHNVTERSIQSPGLFAMGSDGSRYRTEITSTVTAIRMTGVRPGLALALAQCVRPGRSENILSKLDLDNTSERTCVALIAPLFVEERKGASSLMLTTFSISRLT